MSWLGRVGGELSLSLSYSELEPWYFSLLLYSIRAANLAFDLVFDPMSSRPLIRFHNDEPLIL